MRYLDLKEQLKASIVFTPTDIKKNEPDFDSRRLSEWQDKRYIKKIRRGFYIFSDLELNESALFVIANKIYTPSYISLEMALSHYNLIPESVYGVTSVASKKTSTFTTTVGEFIYHKIKPELMFGYKLVDYKNQKFRIAEIEKAVIDYFYINSNLKTNADFFEMRFNAEVFKKESDMKKLNKYLAAFNNKNLTKRVKKFLHYVGA